jgi:alanyl-tRNA synthetase
VSAGVRRIEAVTGRKAYELVQTRFAKSAQAANLVGSTPDNLPEKVASLMNEINLLRKKIERDQQADVLKELNIFAQDTIKVIEGVTVQVISLHESVADPATLRQKVDEFRQQHPRNGIIVLGSIKDEKPIIVAGVTDDLVSRGLNAIDLIQFVAAPIGGGGGGKPTLAQAGGKDPTKLDEALQKVDAWVQERVKAD